MKILLVKDAPQIGRAGEIKEVSDGHARNFLIPRGYAVPASDNVVTKHQKEAQEKIEKQARDKKKLEDLTKKLSKILITISAKAGKEHLFAAIRESEIAKAIKDQSGIEIDPGIINLPKPIKSIGSAIAEIKLDSNHKSVVHLEIKPS